MFLISGSPLTQGRELKYFQIPELRFSEQVAPHTGAGIEIVNRLFSFVAAKSPLTQGRELKYKGLSISANNDLSPLTQGRELKSNCWSVVHERHESPLTQGRELKFASCTASNAKIKVAPHTGAGIEIRTFCITEVFLLSRPSHRGGN